ncbi:MAG: hypothetical protein AAF705_22725, partial [Bacteroidota bacterium]
LKKGDISEQDAEAEKKRIAAYHAKRINEAVALEEEKLHELIKNRVSGKLEIDKDQEEEDGRTFLAVPAKVNYYKDSITGLRIEKRWTTQFVLSLAVNTVLNDDGGFYGNGFRVNPLGYGEVGFTYKYRIKEESALWNLKLGFSAMFNEIRPKDDNRILVTNGNQTTIEDAGFDIIRSRFANIYLGIPVHLELDFSKPQFNNRTRQTYLRSQRGFRLGVGGFFAVRLYTFQFIRFDQDGKRNRLQQEDDFNMNTISFGPSAYIGYRDVSLYMRYDANPMFRNNPQDVNNLSIGLRVDIN